MKEFTSTVTLTFEINNLEAVDKNDYIDRLMAQYLDLYDLEIKEHEITNIEEYTWSYRMNISDLLCDLYDIRNMAELCKFGDLPKDNEGTSTTIFECLDNCITQLLEEQRNENCSP